MAYKKIESYISKKWNKKFEYEVINPFNLKKNLEKEMKLI